jgi:cytochrome P450
MSVQPTERVIEVPERKDFVHSANAALSADPWNEWDRLRSETPIFKSDMPNPVIEGSSLWYFLDYQSVYTAMRDTETFSNVGSAHPFSEGDPYSMIPGELDPPEHGKYRSALNPLFAPKAIRQLEDGMRATCIELIERFAENGECDFVSQFALHFPTTVFMRMMGLPAEDFDQLTHWVHTFSQSMGTDAAIAAAVQAEQEVLDYLDKKLDERAADHQDDLLTAITTMLEDDATVSRKERLATAYLIFQAGMDTVASQLGWTFRYFAEHPEDRQAIIDDPSRIPGAVEEALRCFDILSQTLIVAKDAEIGGCPIKAKDRVVTMMSAANRDPNEFPNANEFDMMRKPNRHLAFGVGPHRCIGAHLARLEMVVALQEWHKRIPNYRVVPGAQLGQRVNWAVTSMASLPLEWKVGAAE